MAHNSHDPCFQPINAEKDSRKLNKIQNIGLEVPKIATMKLSGTDKSNIN